MWLWCGVHDRVLIKAISLHCVRSLQVKYTLVTYHCACVRLLIMSNPGVSLSLSLSLFLSHSLSPPTALLSMPVAAFTQFIPVYHIFHDFHGVHTGLCLAVMLALYILLVWTGDRQQNGTETKGTAGCEIPCTSMHFQFDDHYLLPCACRTFDEP